MVFIIMYASDIESYASDIESYVSDIESYVSDFRGLFIMNGLGDPH